MAIYSEVTPDVLGLAAEVVSHYHPALQDAKMGFIFQDEASIRFGKQVLGTAQKISDKQRAAGLDMDYLITIALDVWKSLSLTQKKALIDHELCHCDYAYGEAKMRGHDIEEFNCIVERYGLWKPDLKEFGISVNQAMLPGLEPLRRMGAILAVEPEMAEAI